MMPLILPDHLDHTGTPRKLGYIAPDPTKQMMRATKINIQQLRQSLGKSPLIQPGDPEWREVDYVKDSPKELIADQGSEGSCTAWSCVGGQARQRWMREGVVLLPSGYYVYDCINNGVDQGSSILESMDVIQRIGAPPISAYPKCKYPGHVPSLPSGTMLYREDVPITGSSALEAATMILMGILFQGPIYVDNTFEHFTKDGVAWNGNAPRTGSTNHSVYFAGIKFLNGDPHNWYLLLVNSWRYTWGFFSNGTCLCPPAGLDNGSYTNDGYGHGSTLQPVASQGSASPTLAV